MYDSFSQIISVFWKYFRIFFYEIPVDLYMYEINQVVTQER